MFNADKKSESITNAAIAELSSAQQAPCLSLYQSTDRRHPDNQEDPIRFRNLMKKLQRSLSAKYQPVDVQQFLEPFEKLASDSQFWNHTLDGLAVLSCPNFFRIFTLSQQVPELAIVADTFHIKPLLRFLQSIDRYQVLGLSRDMITLFEGNRHGLRQVDLVVEVPKTIAEALGRELTEPHQTVASYGGVGGTSSPMHHSHGGKSDELDVDTERFFRAVDRAMLKHYSSQSNLPLILAALPEHHKLFHQVSHNSFLVAQGIKFNPDSISQEELRVRAWEIFEPGYKARLTSFGREFEQARTDGIGSDDLEQIAQAACSGRVSTLIIDSDRRIPGHLNAHTGKIDFGNMCAPDTDDLLDDLGELVTKKGGQVMIIPSELMKTRTGVAATYRY